MRKVQIKEIAKGILFILFVGILINKSSASLAISTIPTPLSLEDENQLLPSCSDFEFPNNLYPGYFNTQVECLQLLLKQNAIIYPEGLVTGFYGPLTRQAVARLNQVIEKASTEKNYFFDYEARTVLNAVAGEARLKFIKNLTLTKQESTAAVPQTTTTTTTAPTVTTKVVPIPSTTITTLHLPDKVTSTTLPASTVSVSKTKTLLSWWKILDAWIVKTLSAFKKASPTNSNTSTTSSIPSGNGLGVPQIAKVPSFFAKILINLSKVKILNRSLVKSSEKEITTFTFPTFNSTGIIDAKNQTIKIQVPNGTDVKALKPNIIISAKASILPLAEQVTDYSRPVVYTVTAENKSTSSYVVTVTEAPKSAQNTLTGLKVKEYDSSTVIDNQVNVITLTLPPEADLTNLTILLEAAPYAETDPISGTSLNLKTLKTITVKAQNGDLRMYGLRVIKQSLTTTTTSAAAISTLVTKNSSISTVTTSTTTTILVTTKPVSPVTSITTTTLTNIKPTVQTTNTTSSTTPKITTSTTRAQAVSTSTTMPLTPVTTATTIVSSTTITTKASSTIIINDTSTTSPTQTTSTLATTVSTLANTPKLQPANSTIPTAPVLKSALPIGLRDFLSAFWPTILIGFITVSILELVFVLLKTDALSRVLGQRTMGTKFVSCFINNSKIKIDLDQRKRLITLTIPLGEQVLTKELILTRDPNSRLALAPKPEEIIKDGDNYVLTSLEGDQIIYTVKIKRV